MAAIYRPKHHTEDTLKREEEAVRTLIVHNPRSGFGSDAIFQFERALVKAGDECVLRMLADDFDPRESVVDAADFDVVVVSGGDGTAASVLHALAGSKVPVCVFPSGTANLYCANLGNTTEPQALARACRVGSTADLDLGEISWETTEGGRESRGFALMSGMGYDAQLMRAALPNKQALGEAAYYAAALENRHPSIADFKITVDGEVHERRGIMCLVANNAMIQNEISIIPGCRMDDGLIDVIIIEIENAAQLVRPILHGLFDRSGQKTGRPHIESFSGRRITVESSEPMPIEVDGEVCVGLVSRYEARANPEAARVIVDAMSSYGKEKPERPRFGEVEDRAFPK